MEKSFTPSAVRKRKWREENTELYLKRNRENSWRIAGINVEEATELRDRIKFCQICDKETGRLCVDHNHLTTKIRGVLCDPCNRGLGYFKDSTALLRKAVEYLESEVDKYGKVVYN